MNSFWLKILVIAVMLFSESLAIWYEMIGARNYVQQQSIGKIFLYLTPAVLGAGFGLLLAYVLGIKAFKNIWVVSVISITSIVIAEPILIYAVFRELPTRGAAIGFVLGVMGLLSALFIK